MKILFPIITSALLIFLATLTGCGQPSNAADTQDSVQSANSTAASERQADWPRWRGSNFDGISPELPGISTWEEDPPILWEREIGTGFSSFAVVNGKVFTMGCALEDGQDEEKEKKVTDTIWCLDAETGDVTWKHSYPSILVDNLHEGGPAATPTISQGRVYTVGKQGQLVCVDQGSGKPVWERELSKDLGVEMPEWGFSSSVLITGGLAIVEAGRLAAFDADSGEPVWASSAFKPGYGSPVPWDFVDDAGNPHACVTSLNNECLLVVSRKDGEEIARRAWTTSYDTSAATPTVLGDKVFISTGYNRGCLLARIQKAESGADNPFVLEEIYEHNDMCNHMNNCVLWDGYFYGFNGNSSRSRTVKFTCMNAESGEVAWTEMGLGCGSLMIAGGKIIALSDDGELVIIQPSPDGYEELGRSQILEGRCWTVPVLSGGKIFARNAKGKVVCVDLSNGV